MNEHDRLQAALEGDPKAIHELVVALSPIVQARVARALMRRAERRGRDIRQEVEDLTQEVFLAMFTDDNKFLRTWDPTLGLSLQNFVGLLAQRRVISIMRTSKRTPWFEEACAEPMPLHAATAYEHPELAAHSRQLLQRLLERLEETLSPRAFDLFTRLYVHEEDVAAVSEATGINPNALHQWKRRLGLAARAELDKLRGVEPERPIASGDAARFEVTATRGGVEP